MHFFLKSLLIEIATQIQRNLQVRIEEQGKQLQMMFDMQQKSTNNFFKTT